LAGSRVASVPHVADLLEALSRVAPAAPVRSPRDGTRAQALRFARTCYDHLAGQVGVVLMDALVEREHLEPDRSGGALARGPAVVARRSGTASTGASSARTWAGAVGAALTNRLFELGWIRRSEHDRAVHVTADGRDGFAEVFQVSAVPGAA
jgi:hypothetical protein